ncbi:hypothetical protein ACI4CU_28910, partial [Klebsiella pneumoniae]|uniref:hypothetical protein n=1 Tax=Klebsiella pneumoniae TaxID=573 RepID=UPI003853DAFB
RANIQADDAKDDAFCGVSSPECGFFAVVRKLNMLFDAVDYEVIARFWFQLSVFPSHDYL